MSNSLEGPAEVDGSSHPVSLYLALLVAWIATLGSLYFSEFRHFVPCTLCWYQRILMYPMALILGLGIILKIERLPLLILPFSLLGQGVAGYHYLLQKTTLFGGVSVCTGGSPCTTMWINWFGFVTIPFLAMVAFSFITIAALVAAYTAAPALVWGRGRIAVVAGVVIASTILYGVAGAQVTRESSESTIPFESIVLNEAPEQSPVGEVESVGVQSGERLYMGSCAGCHGVDGAGVDGLGSNLLQSNFVHTAPEPEVVAMVRKGRAADDKDNASGIPMPPSGGNSNLSDSELVAIVDYLRSLSSE